MYIDVHSHLGKDCVFDEDFTLQALMDKHRECGISKSIIQPGTCHDHDSVKAQHDVIYDITKKYQGQFFGMANPNPHLDDALYGKEIRRCIEELNFVAIKVHPLAHAVNPLSRDGKKVFEWASKLKVPVMVHTGAGIPFSNPCHLIPIAEAFPDVQIIMAHCGQMIMAAEVPIVMERCLNVYAEVTWTGGFLVQRWAEKFGPHRLMFGSDHAENAMTELQKIKTSGLGDQDLEWLLYKTAEKVFKI